MMTIRGGFGLFFLVLGLSFQYQRDHFKGPNLDGEKIPKSQVRKAVLDQDKNNLSGNNVDLSAVEVNNNAVPPSSIIENSDISKTIIEQKGDRIVELAEEYDQNLSDKEARMKLSQALKDDEEYRSAILEKFKSERSQATN